MTGKLDGKVAVITGGNSGIGLAAEGARVALLGRDTTTLDAAVAELGGETMGMAGDVQNMEDLDRLYEEVRAAFGSIDVLFVNAGLANLRPIEDVGEAHFDLTFGVNVKGAYFTVQKALPLMNDGGGSCSRPRSPTRPETRP